MQGVAVIATNDRVVLFLLLARISNENNMENVTDSMRNLSTECLLISIESSSVLRANCAEFVWQQGEFCINFPPSSA